GWTALALLSSAQVAALLNDRIVGGVKHFHVPGETFALALGTFGLFCGVLGTCGAVWTFLTSGRAPGVARRSLRWFTPRPWWPLPSLALALAILFLANALLPTPAGLLGLVLLLLGTGAGVFGYLADSRARGNGGPARLGISPRGWISLGLLTLATS